MSKTRAPKPEERNRRGRQSGLKNIDLEQVEAVASLGFIDKEIAAVLGIAKSTLNNWKKNDEFLDSLKRGKLKADLQITKGLYEKAKAGDTTAMIFWLKNRRPDRWRDKRDFEHSGRIDSVLTFEFGDIAPEAGPRAAEEQEEDGE